MSALVAAIARRSLPALASSQPRQDGIGDWLTSGSFQIDGSSSPQRLLLRNIVQSEFITYQLFDFQRFALSSFETFAFCRTDPARPRALSWPLLKMYYAGFFGGHAIMRSTGQAIIRLETLQTNKIALLAQFACGPHFVMSPGTYHLRLKQNPDLTLDVELSVLSETGGSHATFWRAFKTYLEELSIIVAKDGDPDANFIIGKISDLQSVLTGRGSSAGSWLSQIRNRINYRHDYGVWFPFGAPNSEVTYIGELNFRSLPNVRLDYDQRRQLIQAFCAGCLFTARLSYDVSNLLVATATNHRASFVRSWLRLQDDFDEEL
jgi:hypothetical protein